MVFLKNAIKAVDPTPDKKKELTLSVNLLFELAEQKKAIQYEVLMQLLRTAGTDENPSIPITNTLASHSETRAYVSSNAGNLVETVTGAVTKFIGGGADNIVNGIGELITGGLEAILGAGSGTQSEMHSYYIIVEGFSIVRFDIVAWQRRIEATGITREIENAMTFTAIKSSVDVDRITFNTFLQAYKKQLEKLQFGDAELKKFIIEAKEIFELLRDPSSNKQKALELFNDEGIGTPAINRSIDSNSIFSRNENILFTTYDYSFRLGYDVYEDDEYKGTVKTDWQVYYRGHNHGVQPTPQEINMETIVLTGEVEVWCQQRGIIVPEPEVINDNKFMEKNHPMGN